MERHPLQHDEREVQIPSGPATLAGTLTLPAGARGIVLFAHGSGSSRHSARNRFVAGALHQAGLGTLLFDLLTEREGEIDAYTREFRFDIPRLAERLVGATRWIDTQSELRWLRVGYFGASTGSAAALIAAAKLYERIGAVVSRGGRPDLALAELTHVHAPTLLIVGGNDDGVIELNESAYRRLKCEKHLAIVPGASHLFEEPGTLDQVAKLAADWFRGHLADPHA